MRSRSPWPAASRSCRPGSPLPWRDGSGTGDGTRPAAIPRAAPAPIPEQVFLDADTGRASQRRWLQAVRSHADRLNPGFGHVAYSYTNGATALENSLPPRRHRREERDPTFTVGACRQFLRGYSWLTVVPEQLAARLPGVDELRDGGAFVEVEPLENGGLWLLATEVYRGYDEDAIGRVFTALAPVLRRGTPARQPRYPGEPPYPIVFEDAATRTAPPR